jgi:hypothetical protein
MPARFEALASSAHQHRSRKQKPGAVSRPGANRQFQFQDSNDFVHLVKVVCEVGRESALFQDMPWSHPSFPTASCACAGPHTKAMQARTAMSIGLSMAVRSQPRSAKVYGHAPAEQRVNGR